MIGNREAFIRANATPQPVGSLPQISLYQASEVTPLWLMTEADLTQDLLPPPFWAFPWAGGQAVAKYVLENPEIVAKKRVLDLACGSGLVGIATRLAGAVEVICNDIDPYCEAAVKLNTVLNARNNDCGVAFITGNLLNGDPPDVDLILAGDIAYEKPMLEAMLTFLHKGRDRGIEVYVGDPHRTYFPKTGFLKCADYDIVTSAEIEDTPLKSASVWKLE